MAANFSSTERFRVNMVSSDGGSERVTVQLSLEGLKILNQDGSRTMRSYNLRNVSSWDLMGTSTVIWTKSDVDLEERALTLSGDSTTIRNVVDTLASCCMQLAEVIRDKEEGRHLEELAAGGGKTKKAAKLPSVDSVEYWRAPDKAGWLQSQSEVMKMWRKRWFVLKQGYLFRFLSPDVSESVKPRGVVDLSKVQDVKDGRSVTGKANTLQLKTASVGSVCYVCDSETEMVEWISALEGSIAKIVKQLAGVDDSSSDGHTKSSSSREKHRSSSSRNRDTGSDWAKQVERSLSHGTSSSSSRRGGSSTVNYPGSGSGGGGRASAPYHDDYGISSYNQISGIAGVASALDDLTLNYGGYPATGGSSGTAAAAAGGGGYGSSSTPYGSAPTYGSSGAYGAGGGYGGSSNAAAAGGYDSSSYGYGTSGAAAAAGGGGYGSSASPYGGAPSAYDVDPSGAYGVPAAANGYGSYSQQQPVQQPAAYGTSPGGYGGQPQAGYYQQQPQQQQPPQQQQQQQPAVSLIDQVPTQQPAYPAYYQYPTAEQGQVSQEAAPAIPAPAPAPAAAPPAPAPGSVWQVHHTAEGLAYYYNSSTGATQWELPPGM